MSSDYLEIELYLDDEEDVTVLITLTDRSMLSFSGVHGNPVRSHGSWAISHILAGQDVSSYIPAEQVRYFTVMPPQVRTERHTGTDRF